MSNQASKLVGGGLSANAANAITGDTATALTATGSTQATALAIGASNNFVGTTAASTGVILPLGNNGDSIFIYNGGANTLTVYPPVGGTINNLSANTGFSVATLKSVLCVYSDADSVATILSA